MKINFIHELSFYFYLIFIHSYESPLSGYENFSFSIRLLSATTHFESTHKNNFSDAEIFNNLLVHKRKFLMSVCVRERVVMKTSLWLVVLAQRILRIDE
jgi:hypothetical protein